MLEYVTNTLQDVASQPLSPATLNLLPFKLSLGQFEGLRTKLGTSGALGGVLLGVSLSKFRLAAKGADTSIRWIGGLLMIAAGFYFIITF